MDAAEIAAVVFAVLNVMYDIAFILDLSDTHDCVRPLTLPGAGGRSASRD